MTSKSNIVQMVAAALLLVSCINERNYESYLAPESDAMADAVMADGTGDVARGDMRLSKLDLVVDLLVDVRDVYDLEVLPEIDGGDQECIPECDDGDPCNGSETCNLETGECEAGESVVCDDGLSCNGLESCSACSECEGGYECLAEGSEECDDGNPCTEDSCSPEADEMEALTGCLFIPLDDGFAPEGECDDQNPCTFDNCLEGGCDNPVKSLEELGDDVDLCVCSSDDDCLALDDQIQCNGTLACLAAPEPPEEEPDLMLCQVDPETVPDCAALDALYCNGQESCAECPECDSLYSCEAGEPPVLDDFLACTIDECDEEADEVAHILTDGLCDDGNVCTTDLCDPAADGADADSGCVYAVTQPAEDEETVPCIPDDPCVVNGTCDEIVCVGENLSELSPAEHEDGCNDGNVCTEDYCNETDDGPECSHETDPEVTDCEDGDLCTLGDLCVDMVCVSGPPPACDDLDACTLDGCDLATGDCTYLPVEIDDADPCTTDACDQESGEITHAPKDFDDDLFCNGVESCDPQSGEKVAGISPAVDDGVDCTTDLCDEVNDVALNIPDDVSCGDGAYCNGTEVCDVVQGCLAGAAVVCDDELECTEDSCDEDQEGCKFDPDNTLCADEVTCTIDELCDVDSGCDATLDHEFCDDGNDCTDDLCDPEDGCLNTPVQDGGDCVLTDPCYTNATCQAGMCSGEFDLDTCGDRDHDGLAGEADVCPFAFNPGSLEVNSIPGADACEELSAHGSFSFQRALALSQEGKASQWRRTHEPVEIPLANGILDDSVFGYWKLDGGEANDYSGKDNHGSIVGGAATTGAFGQPEEALEFDGGSSVSIAAPFQKVDSWCYSLWFRPDSLVGTPYTTLLSTDEGYLNWQADGNFDLLVWKNGAGTGDYFIGRADKSYFQAGAWNHLAACVANDSVSLYANGSLVFSGVATSGTTDNLHAGTVIGARYLNGDIFGPSRFEGDIDEVLIFNRALSPDEIETYYRSNAPYGTNFVPGSQADFDDIRVTEVGDDGKEFVKRSRIIGPRPHSDTPCPMDADDGTWADRDDLCGVLGYWALDGDLDDTIGTSNGIPVGSPGPATEEGRFGDESGCIEFDGTQNWVEIPKSAPMKFAAGDFTLEFWVLIEDAGGGPMRCL